MVGFTLENLDNTSPALTVLTGGENFYPVFLGHLNNRLSWAHFEGEIVVGDIDLKGVVFRSIRHGLGFLKSGVVSWWTDKVGPSPGTASLTSYSCQI